MSILDNLNNLGKKAQEYAGVAVDKARDLAEVAADKAKNATDTAKLNMAILTEQRELEKNYRAIGEWFISEYTRRDPRRREGCGGRRQRLQGPHRRDGGREGFQVCRSRERADEGGRERRQREGLPRVRRGQRGQVLPPLRRSHGRVRDVKYKKQPCPMEVTPKKLDKYC